MKRVLVIAAHRLDRSPGQRYRFEQYFKFLGENNIQMELSNLLNEEEDKILYSKGRFFSKFKIAVKTYFKRRADLKKVKSGSYDAVLVYREAIITPGIWFERKVSKYVPLLFDFDDAIWVKDVSAGNKILSFLKDENKIRKILPYCTHVTAGNAYLANFAKQYSDNVTIIPSTIDTDKYVPMDKPTRPVTIGWVGSHTTVKHFEIVKKVYKKLIDRYEDKIQFTVIGDPNYRCSELNLKGVAWQNEREVELFNSIDIGVMPLEEDDWTQGKCGMKGLLYMSVGVPAVMSAVGMNTDIVKNGENGFTPSGEEAWFNVLSELIENPDLRTRIGQQGRVTVENLYSINANKELFLKVYEDVLGLNSVSRTINSIAPKSQTARLELDLKGTR